MQLTSEKLQLISPSLKIIKRRQATANRASLFKGRPQAPLNGWMQGGGEMGGRWGGALIGCLCSSLSVLKMSQHPARCLWSYTAMAFLLSLSCFSGCYHAISREVILLNRLLLLCSGDTARYLFGIHPQNSSFARV